MKQIIAYIRPAVLERVTEVLREIKGLSGMSVLDIKGFGQGKGAFCRDERDGEITWFCKFIRIELMVSDTILGEVVEAIREQAWTGERGEGKIYILEVVEAVRIRTNERGEAAV
ncbi:MAG: P-II family nitrogen regulator [Desulfocapsaceae bacterium]|jgi:nitrogen regulatory protein PII|nr:P-II family nitrogen regulator [Desulfocapsaceae bacterium]